MLVRRGVAGCILAILVLLPLVAYTAGSGGGLDALSAIGRYTLLGLAGVLVAWEAMLVLRKPLARARRARARSGARGGAAADADADDMVGMLSDALKLARPSRAVKGREPVDVTELVADLIIRMGSERVDLAGRPRAIYTLASRPALMRALEIVIENALASGSRVVVSCDSGTSALAVHVDDDGPGIPRSARTQVLEWQYYMATPPSQQAGCKVEVVIARQIARAHGGEVIVGCSPLGGARFTVRLPLMSERELELTAAS